MTLEFTSAALPGEFLKSSSAIDVIEVFIYLGFIITIAIVIVLLKKMFGLSLDSASLFGDVPGLLLFFGSIYLINRGGK